MNLQQRIALLGRLGEYMQSDDPAWKAAKEQAYIRNNWFIPDFVDKSVENIATRFLQPGLLAAWAQKYAGAKSNDAHNVGAGPHGAPNGAPNNASNNASNNARPVGARPHDAPGQTTDPGHTPGTPKNVGLVMAGNIPLVGFHDFLCVLVSGHRQTVKLSSKDDVLLKHMVGKLLEWEPALGAYISFSDMLKNCDAYIATGSNNSSRYFEYYFGKYPSIIRRNRTSVALLTGAETGRELELLSDDVQLYFGLGCRSVTKLYVPRGYDFLPLLDALRKYGFFFEHNKYRNNYDYQLAMYLMNSQFYMTNDSIVLLEQKGLFSPIGTLYYEFYEYGTDPGAELRENNDIQCIIGNGHLPFGTSQTPGLEDYADGVDTMAFLSTLSYI